MKIDLEEIKSRIFDYLDSVKMFNFVGTVVFEEHMNEVLYQLKAAREFIDSVETILYGTDFPEFDLDKLKLKAIERAFKLYEKATK